MNPKTDNDNVVQLPTYASEKQLFDAQSSIKFAKDVKAEFCREAGEFAFEQLFANFKAFGFFQDGNSRVNVKDILLVEQAIESILFRYYGLDHQMHGVVEGMFFVTDEDELEDESDEVELEDE